MKLIEMKENIFKLLNYQINAKTIHFQIHIEKKINQFFQLVNEIE